MLLATAGFFGVDCQFRQTSKRLLEITAQLITAQSNQLTRVQLSAADWTVQLAIQLGLQMQMVQLLLAIFHSLS